MQEIKEQVIAIFDKPESCIDCPFIVLYDHDVNYCKLSKDIVINPHQRFGENKNCLLIDHDEYHESLDIDNYK